MKLFPKFIFMSLQSPASVLLGYESFTFDDAIDFRGRRIYANDTPWIATVGDLLIDCVDRAFVGMTFQITERNWSSRSQALAKKLDPNVVRYTDISSADDQKVYPGEAGRACRFEIFWKRPKRSSLEWAQLICGQWSCWYTSDGAKDSDLIAFSITGVDDIVNEYDIVFPEVTLPLLTLGLSDP